MKFFLRLLPLLFAAAFLAAATSAPAAEQLYTCGMHPQIIKHEPGNCPICGMKLVPVRAGEADGTTIQIDPATVQRMNLRTAVVQHGPVRREIRTVGTVAYNEEGLRDITMKYEGWIEKLFVNTTWATVKAGEPLFEIYSPELYNAEFNYAVALRTEGDAGGALTRGALARLQLFDVPAAALADLQRTKEPHRTLVFRAPTDGIVIEKMGVVGQMMKPGERVYRLADLSSVWVQAEVYEKDLPFVHAGEPVTVQTSYGPARSFSGQVSLVLPQVQEQTRTATARIVLANPDGFLRPGMFVDVRFSARLAKDAVLVRDLAVLRSGERNTVFVALGDGFFAPREITLGVRSAGDNYEVLSGLRAGERVVTSGQFMLDSESQLRDAIQKMTRPEDAAPPISTSPADASHAPAPHEDDARATSDASALKALAFAMADAAAPLANDDLAGYRRQLATLRTALAGYFAANPHAAHGPLAEFQGDVKEPADLKEARRQFAPLSTAIADVARATLALPDAGLHEFECPMAPVVVKGRWLQRTAELRNPFYGSAMLTCGEEIK